MSFLSTLGKIASIAAPLVAAPFTGGASLLGLSAGHAAALGAGLGGLGKVLGSGASASQAGRYTNAELNSGLNSGNNRDLLNAAQFNRDLPAMQASQVARGDLMSQPIPQAGHIGSGRDLQFTGGIGPQLFGADTHQAGSELKRQALSSLMTGSGKVTPTTTTLQAPGALEKIGGATSLAGGILGTLGQFKPPVSPAAGVPTLGAPDSGAMWNQLPQIPQPQAPQPDAQNWWDQLPQMPRG